MAQHGTSYNRIMRLLEKKGSLTAWAAARETGLSHATCKRNLRLLERDGYALMQSVQHRPNVISHVYYLTEQV